MDGNVAMYSNGYLTYDNIQSMPSDSSEPSEELIPYPTGLHSMYATGRVDVHSAADDSSLSVYAGSNVGVHLTGD